jgi:methylase of polypeptide subunit release factors
LSEPAGDDRRSIEIGGLTIAYDERVLEPRPWTAEQSAWAAELLASLPMGPVLELCSGAGHIGLVAMREHDRRLVQVDVDLVACDFARLNAEGAGLADRVDVRCGPMEDVVLPDERFPLVIADPPWVSTNDVRQYPEDPLVAIDGGPEGLDVAHRCVQVASRVLTPMGACLLQLGTAEQVDAVSAYVKTREELYLAVGETREFERGVVVRLDRA